MPTDDFFGRLCSSFPSLPLIAEDLGIITPDVSETITRLGLLGTKILLFAFGEDNPMHIYLPHTYGRNCVVYTGTHDNNTATLRIINRNLQPLGYVILTHGRLTCLFLGQLRGLRCNVPS